MEDYRIRFYTPVTTGTPHVSRPGQPSQPKEAEGQAPEQAAAQTTFRQALEDQLQKSSDVSFSKHAVNRAIERKLDLSEDNIARLNKGVRLAEEKKLEDPLILVDKTAFLVNMKHNRVITTVDAEELMGNVFTNIDGTVII
ncbi:MAG: flagellar protein [Clostridiales bacterium]|nr:flagellar protein [Clostridiales bacterium]